MFRQSFKMKVFLSTLIILMLGFVFLVNCNTGKKSKEFRIGILVPLTGGAAEFGKWARNGVLIGVEELNSNTENSEKKIVPIFEDQQMDSKLALTEFKKLTDIDKTKAVITSGSGVVLAIAPEAERNHIIQINHAAVSSAIRKAGEYTFTLVNDGDIETDEIAKLAYKKLEVKRLAVLYANTAYGEDTKNSIIKSFQSIGGDIVASIAFKEDFTDLRAQIFQLIQIKPDAVYFIATIKDSGRILIQSKELGFKTQWLTYNAFESPIILKIAGDAAEGVIYTSSNLFDLPNPPDKAKYFLETYMKKYGEKPNLYAATAYDGVNILYLAFTSTNGSPENMQKFLMSIKNYEGASGLISFDIDGSVRKPVFLKIVRNGKFELY